MSPEWEWRAGVVVKSQASAGGASSQEAKWVFVAESDFARGSVRTRRVPPARNRVLLRASAGVGTYATVKGRIVNRGVDVARLSARTGLQIRPVQVAVSSSLDGHAKARAAGALSIYRPRIVARTDLDLRVPVDAHATTRARVDIGVPPAERVDPSIETTIEGSTSVDTSVDMPPRETEIGIGGGADMGVGGGLGAGIGGGGGLRIGR
jgi:hypothetical protein